MDLSNPCKFVLLTGAGFSANFGGFLASQMWAKIFNRTSSNPNLREALFGNQNFEDVYFSLKSSGPSKDFDELHVARRDIVVNEENHLTPPPYLMDLFNDPINRSVVMSGTEIRLDRTEVALEAATTGKFDQPNW